MFIALWPAGSVKLHRSGMARLQPCRRRLAKALLAAPTELEDGFVRLPCYKHVAPTGASPSGSRALEDPCKVRRGLAHSKSSARCGRGRASRSVVECGGAPPLLLARDDFVNRPEVASRHLTIVIQSAVIGPATSPPPEAVGRGGPRGRGGRALCTSMVTGTVTPLCGWGGTPGARGWPNWAGGRRFGTCRGQRSDCSLWPAAFLGRLSAGAVGSDPEPIVQLTRFDLAATWPFSMVPCLLGRPSFPSPEMCRSK